MVWWRTVSTRLNDNDRIYIQRKWSCEALNRISFFVIRLQFSIWNLMIKLYYEYSIQIVLFFKLTIGRAKEISDIWFKNPLFSQSELCRENVVLIKCDALRIVLQQYELLLRQFRISLENFFNWKLHFTSVWLPQPSWEKLVPGLKSDMCKRGKL